MCRSIWIIRLYLLAIRRIQRLVNIHLVGCNSPRIMPWRIRLQHFRRFQCQILCPIRIHLGKRAQRHIRPVRMLNGGNFFLFLRRIIEATVFPAFLFFRGNGHFFAENEAQRPPADHPDQPVDNQSRDDNRKQPALPV